MCYIILLRVNPLPLNAKRRGREKVRRCDLTFTDDNIYFLKDSLIIRSQICNIKYIFIIFIMLFISKYFLCISYFQQLSALLNISCA